MSDDRIVPSALAAALVEPLGPVFAITAEGVALAAVFKIVVDSGPNGTTANKVFAVLNRHSMVPETFAAVQKMLDRLVAEGFIASVAAPADLQDNFYLLTEVGYLRAVGFFPGLFKPASRSKKK